MPDSMLRSQAFKESVIGLPWRGAGPDCLGPDQCGVAEKLSEDDKHGHVRT